MPHGGQQLELLLEVGEERGCRLGPDHGRRVAVEGDDGRRQAPVWAGPGELGDERR